MSTTYNLLTNATKTSPGAAQLFPAFTGTVTITVTGGDGQGNLVGSLSILAVVDGDFRHGVDVSQLQGLIPLTITAAGTYIFSATNMQGLRAILSAPQSAPVSCTATF